MTPRSCHAGHESSPMHLIGLAGRVCGVEKEDHDEANYKCIGSINADSLITLVGRRRCIWSYVDYVCTKLSKKLLSSRVKSRKN